MFSFNIAFSIAPLVVADNIVLSYWFMETDWGFHYFGWVNSYPGLLNVVLLNQPRLWFSAADRYCCWSQCEWPRPTSWPIVYSDLLWNSKTLGSNYLLYRSTDISIRYIFWKLLLQLHSFDPSFPNSKHSQLSHMLDWAPLCSLTHVTDKVHILV